MRASCALRRRVLLFGRAAEGQLGVAPRDARQPTDVTEPFKGLAVTSIAAGPRATAAVVEGGGVLIAGAGARGELGLGRSLLSTPSAAKIICDTAAPFQRVVLGPSTTALLTADGHVYTCGEGREGALGHGGAIGPQGSWHGGSLPDAVYEPTRVESLVDARVVVRDVALSRHFSLLLSDDGVVYACGSGFHGELGLGAAAFATAPSRVAGLPDAGADPVTGIAAGSSFSLAVTRGGRVFFWGRAGFGGSPGLLGAASAGGGASSSSSAPPATILRHPTPTELLLPGLHDAGGALPPAQLTVRAGAQHALITDGRSRAWMLGYFSGALLAPSAPSAPARAATGASLLDGESATYASAAAALPAAGSSPPAPPLDCSLRQLDLAAALGGQPAAAISAIACGPFSAAFVADGQLLMLGKLLGRSSGEDGAAAFSALPVRVDVQPGRPAVITDVALGGSHAAVVCA